MINNNHFSFSYRSITGVCNNHKNPIQGAFDTVMSRILPAAYDDDIHSVRKSINGNELPNARVLSERIYSETSPFPLNTYPVVGNVGSILFSQTIVHDFAGQKLKQTEGTGPGANCCTNDRSKVLQPELQTDSCLPIPVPANDSFYSEHNVQCLNFVRSQTLNKNDCSFRQAQQTNFVTHYIDGSFVYGSTDEVANELRSHVGGALLMEDNILPPNNAGGFRAGDGRALQTPQLAFYHSIYYREHNRLAAELAGLNPTWTDEQIYQQARRIVIALIQHHTYDEFLPIFIGEAAALSNGLLCRDDVFCDCYDEDIDASVINEFTTGPGRIFHFFVPNTINLQDAAGNIDTRRLSNLFGASGLLRTNYDDLIRGMLVQPMKTGGFPYELLNHMFRFAASSGLDLLAMDIQRGRDHGLPTYLQVREFCNLPPVFNFETLSWHLVPGVR